MRLRIVVCALLGLVMFAGTGFGASDEIAPGFKFKKLGFSKFKNGFRAMTFTQIENSFSGMEVLRKAFAESSKDYTKELVPYVYKYTTNGTISGLYMPSEGTDPAKIEAAKQEYNKREELTGYPVLNYPVSLLDSDVIGIKEKTIDKCKLLFSYVYQPAIKKEYATRISFYLKPTDSPDNSCSDELVETEARKLRSALETAIKKYASENKEGFKFGFSTENIANAFSLNCAIAPDPLSQLVTCGPAFVLQIASIFKGSGAEEKMKQDEKNYEAEGDKLVGSCITAMTDKDTAIIEFSATDAKSQQVAGKDQASENKDQAAKPAPKMKIECSKKGELIKARLFSDGVLVRQAIRTTQFKPEVKDTAKAASKGQAENK